VTEQAIRKKDHEPPSIEDIELFDQTDGHDRLETVNMVDAVITETDWTPEQAAKALGKSVRTIRRLLRDGTLKGYKVPGTRREEWRVKPVTLSSNESVIVPVTRTTENQDDRLWQLLKEKDAKLEVLVMRTGYLEAQLENYRDQVKLLTDSQHKPGWWTRFCSWLSGR